MSNWGEEDKIHIFPVLATLSYKYCMFNIHIHHLKRSTTDPHHLFLAKITLLKTTMFYACIVYSLLPIVVGICTCR